MSSYVRRLQKKILDKKGVAHVPVYGRRYRGNKLREVVLGSRHRLCAADVGYDEDGTARRASKPASVAGPV